MGKKKKITKLTCVECGQTAKGSDRIHWIYLGSMAIVRSVSRANHIYVRPIENKWVCCVDCMCEHFDKVMENAEKEDQKIKSKK